MTRTVYVNGDYLPEDDAKISVFDRGFLFSDGVYEVSTVVAGKLLDNPAHLARLRRSMAALKLPSPASDEEIVAVQKNLIEKNNLQEGAVYLQVSRGAADRDFAFPVQPRPSLVAFTQPKNLLKAPQVTQGIQVISVPDIRWKRRDIKTVSLLAQSLAKQAAIDAGANDAWMVEDGFVTEGSSNNAFIVDQNGTLITRQLGHEILPGITRAAVLRLTEIDKIKLEERAFTLDEAFAAKEAFITSATTFVWPVVGIDGRAIGDGKPGPVAGKLRELYIDTALASAD